MSASFVNAQVLTPEDSLSAGLTHSDRPTVVSGYGEAGYENHLNENEAKVNLARAVIFLGHKFNDKISFFPKRKLKMQKWQAGNQVGKWRSNRLL